MNTHSKTGALAAAFFALVSSAGSRAEVSKSTATPDGTSTGLGAVVINVISLRNDKGHVLASLFRAKDGYPSETAKSFARKRSGIRERRAQLVFEGIPPGTFAIALFHDENDSAKLDKNFLGIPLEGYGFSRDAKVSMSGPDFEDSKLTLRSGERANIAIRVRY